MIASVVHAADEANHQILSIWLKRATRMHAPPLRMAQKMLEKSRPSPWALFRAVAIDGLFCDRNLRCWPAVCPNAGSSAQKAAGETAEREASAYLAPILHIITTAVRTTIRPRTGVALPAGRLR
jgi:hypothetical protein